MIAQVRTARPAIILNGTDYYKALAPYLVSMEYVDNCDGEKADDLTIELADRDRRFISDWMPDKGTFMDVSIVTERWFALNAPSVALDCGRFWIDTVDFQLPENTVIIKGCSIPTTAHLKTNDDTRGWESASLRELAQQIAEENGMTLLYLSDVNPRYKRVEMNEESQLAFLKQQASDAKLSIKICREKVIIFDEEVYEAQPALFNLVYGDTLVPSLGLPNYKMAAARFTTSLIDTTRRVKIKHSKMETGDTATAEAEDEEARDKFIIRSLNESLDFEEPEEPEDGGEGEGRSEPGSVTDFNVDATADGNRKAKGYLRVANKDRNRATVDLAMGNPIIASGNNCNVMGLGQYDGKWFIVSASHKVGPMFTTSLEIRKCLTGY